MKVTICPICRLTPNLSAKVVKCPKCGRTAFGESLTETLTNWNNGRTQTEEPPKKDEPFMNPPIEEVAKSFIEDVEAVKDQLPEEPFMNVPVEEEVKEEKPKKAPVKRGRKRSE